MSERDLAKKLLSLLAERIILFLYHIVLPDYELL